MNDKNLTVADFGEKRIISEIIAPMCKSRKFPFGIGDDAAMIDIPRGESLLVSTDKIPEDLLSIQLGLMDPYNHGRYLAMVNLSDIAAMGGKPIGLLSTLALPNDFSIEYLKEFYRGFVEGAEEWDVPIIGGDLGWGSVTTLSATVLGSVNPEMVLKRSEAKTKDKLFVTGLIGGFNAALIYFIVAKPKGLHLNTEDENYLKNKLVRPHANIDKGQRLAESYICTSCMDITDGVARTMFELSDYSSKSFMVREDKLPIHHTTKLVADYLGIQPYELVFGIGLDLELMGTISCAEDNVPELLKNDIFLIGEVLEGDQNLLITKEGDVIKIPSKGWQHFSGNAMQIVKDSIKKDIPVGEDALF